ncbi:M10 family metallopeptidase [Amaricoccus macauensis]|uniref:M10 family metallopeptidase n=1 Tax=Amaricoccus macauensis TaxID=57001 RepID=UPI003C7C2734
MTATRTPKEPSDARLAGLVSTLAWDTDSLEYAFPTSASQYGSGYYRSAALPDFYEFSDAQKEAAVRALDVDSFRTPNAAEGMTIEGFTALDISTGSASSAEIRFGNTSSSEVRTATTYYPSGNNVGGDGWYGGKGLDPQVGNSDYKTIMHEIGHAFGLKHPHEEKDGRPEIPEAYDGYEYTVMTYRSEIGGSESNRAETWGLPQTFMMLDIAALQYLYGANYEVNSGDTTYKWKPEDGKTRLDGRVALDPGDNRIFATIWDGGGNDTYDLSAYETDLQIDLNPGESSLFSEEQAAILDWSDKDRAAGNIYNALLYEGDKRSMIENALGGDGDDKIVGNAKNNVLEGGGGKDKLEGGQAADKLKGNSGADKLIGGKGADTLKGGSGKDKLTGGKGADTLGGGAGDDRFIFDDVEESSGKNVDVIIASDGAKAFQGAGRSGGDKIDVSGIDAKENKGGDQAFTFVEFNKNKLDEPGRLWVKEIDGKTYVRGTVDKDKGADFEIIIKDGGQVDAADYIAADFIL